MIDLSLEHDFDIFFRQPIANENQDHVLEMMQHPRSLVTFSDSGAHVAQIMDSSLQTHLLSYWVRERAGLLPGGRRAQDHLRHGNTLGFS